MTKRKIGILALLVLCLFFLVYRSIYIKRVQLSSSQHPCTWLSVDEKPLLFLNLSRQFVFDSEYKILNSQLQVKSYLPGLAIFLSRSVKFLIIGSTLMIMDFRIILVCWSSSVTSFLAASSHSCPMNLKKS